MSRLNIVHKKSTKKKCSNIYNKKIIKDASESTYQQSWTRLYGHQLGNNNHFFVYRYWISDSTAEQDRMNFRRDMFNYTTVSLTQTRVVDRCIKCIQRNLGVVVYSSHVVTLLSSQLNRHINQGGTIENESFHQGHMTDRSSRLWVFYCQ